MSKTGDANKGDTPNKDTVMELYKLYVEMADRISQRRHSANSYFLSINTAMISLLVAFSVYLRLAGSVSSSTSLLVSVVIVVSLVGLANCRIWYLLIQSYKAMSDAKFKVIRKMEEIIGYKPYSDEWQHLEHGENKKVYNKFTVVESRVPIVFSIGYVVATLLSLLTLL